MADDEVVVNGELSNDRSVEMTDDEASSKISGLTQKLADLEREKGRVLEENEGYKKQIEELKVSIEELSRDNGELKEKLQTVESDNQALKAVADRAADLESDVSRLQHDLGSATSDLHDSLSEISGLKRELESAREGDKEKDARLEALVNERDILTSKVVQLEATKNDLGDENQHRNHGKALGLYEIYEKGLGGCSQGSCWILIGGSTIAAAAVIGIACYLRTARKN